MSLGLVGRTPGRHGRLRVTGRNYALLESRKTEQARSLENACKKRDAKHYTFADHLLARLTGVRLARVSRQGGKGIKETMPQKSAASVNATAKDGSFRGRLRSMTAQFRKALGRG